MTVKTFIILVTAVVSLCTINCSDVPHENPLDPLSPGYRPVSTVVGQVLVRSQFNTPVSHSVVSLSGTLYSTSTDAEGIFRFTNISPGTYTLLVMHASFVSDSSGIQVTEGQSEDLYVYLNGLPVVEAAIVKTGKIDQYFPGPVFFAEFSGAVSDPNGVNDIDSVWLYVDTLRFPMNYSLAAKRFQATLYPDSLPSNNIEYLIGKQIFMMAQDQYGAVGKSSSIPVTRIINTEATPVSPNQDTTSAQPVFVWNRAQAEFNYTHTLSVYRINSGNPGLVYSKEGINSLDMQFTYPTVPNTDTRYLKPGNYFWVIAIVDEFGNFARSKEATFLVQ